MPGSTQAMEMDLDAQKSRRDQMNQDMAKWHCGYRDHHSAGGHVFVRTLDQG